MTDFDNVYKEYKVIALPRESQLTPAIVEKIDQLLASAPPHELYREVVEVYHSYIVNEHNALPLNFDRMAHHLHLLIEFLGAIASESGHPEQSKDIS